MSLVYRPARETDLSRAQELVIQSINHLTERHGFGQVATVRPPLFQSFSLADDAGGLWIAEDGGDILGYAFAWVCGHVWFLAELFVAPEQQGRGIGNELLKRMLAHAHNSGATEKALITFSFNTVSQGLYMRHGMFPRLPVYIFSGARQMVTERSPRPRLDYANLTQSNAPLDDLARIDRLALGISREKHHRHLLGDGSMRGVVFKADGACAGYAYVAASGHIGPLAVAQPDHLADAFETALHVAGTGSSAQVSALLPGSADAVCGMAIAHGMRIALPLMLVSTPGFGDWTRYLPRNPGFM